MMVGGILLCSRRPGRAQGALMVMVQTRDSGMRVIMLFRLSRMAGILCMRRSAAHHGGCCVALKGNRDQQ